MAHWGAFAPKTNKSLDSKKSYVKWKLSLNIFQDTGEIIALKVKSKQVGYSTVNEQGALLVLTVHKKHFYANLLWNRTVFSVG